MALNPGKFMYGIGWTEKHFQTWLQANPALPASSRHPQGALLIVHEAAAFERLVDLTAVDGEGNLVLIEVKNERGSRSAIGQLIEYVAAHEDLKLLDLRAPEVLRAEFLALFGKPIAELTGCVEAVVVAPEFDIASLATVQYLNRAFTTSTRTVRFSLLRATQHGDGFRLLYDDRTFIRAKDVPVGQAMTTPTGRVLVHLASNGAEVLCWEAFVGTPSVASRKARVEVIKATKRVLDNHDVRVDLTSLAWQKPGESGPSAIRAARATWGTQSLDNTLVIRARPKNSATLDARSPASLVAAGWSPLASAPAVLDVLWRLART